MKRLVRILLGTGILALSMAAMGGTASAQIDVGFYQVLATKVEGSPRRPIGSVTVPARQATDRSYVETWVLTPGAFESTDEILEIEPAPSADVVLATINGARQLELRAEEHDVDSLADSLATVISPELAVGSDAAAGSRIFVREVWQADSRCGSDADFKLVGVLHGDRQRQVWLLSSEYEYPSGGFAVRTQLRPRRVSGSSAIEVVREISSKIHVHRRIDVVATDSASLSAGGTAESQSGGLLGGGLKSLIERLATFVLTMALFFLAGLWIRGSASLGLSAGRRRAAGR